MENDILKDVQVILSAQGEELDKIRDFLEGEEIFAEEEYYKAIAPENVIKNGMAIRDIQFITDEAQLLQEVMAVGAPDWEELEKGVKNLYYKIVPGDKRVSFSDMNEIRETF